MPRESKTARRQRASRLLGELHRLYPDADCALDHRNAFELLAATILSAQCTDERVNMVTPALFRKYPTPTKLAKADIEDVKDLIRTTGFYNNKAKSLIGMAKGLVEDHNGEVPRTVDELLALPGVARKTANVVLGVAFGIAEGVVVDTHVGRLSVRLRLTDVKDSKNAVKIERDLMQVIPRDDWVFISHALILHGRSTCGARKALCDECPLASDCPSAGKVNPPAAKKATKRT